MTIIRTLPIFDAWLSGIKDRMTQIRLGRRLDKAKRGLLGDVEPIGEGVFEMREHFGPGWRMYYVQRDNELIIMLGGGDKSSQVSDIVKAKHLAAILED
ncbi:MAG: type II toxin-antitoxin system RelE/ParE family toxin [Methylococcaceae bacterium]